MEMQRSQNSQDDLEKEEKVWQYKLPSFKTYYKAG